MSGLTVPAMLGGDFIAHTKTVVDLGYKTFYLAPSDTSFTSSPPPLQECPHPVNLTTPRQFSESVPQDLKKCSATNAERKQLANALQQFSAFLAECPGRNNVLTFRIDTENARPKRFNPRSLSSRRKLC